MAVTAFARLRMLWGAYDEIEAQQSSPGYTAAQIVPGGPSAAVGSGVGVRRVTVTIDRTGVEAALDPAAMHWDFLNMTAGAPDDTWTSSDYTTLEGALSAFFSSQANNMPAGHAVTQYSWHRVGTGVGKPNPAERVTTLGTPINATGNSTSILQAACSITFRTGVRKSWGRTYLPWGGGITSNRRPTAGNVNTIATSAQTLLSTAASSDFHQVVVSKTLASSLNVEKVEVDDVLDVIRRRRHKKATSRTILP